MNNNYLCLKCKEITEEVLKKEFFMCDFCGGSTFQKLAKKEVKIIDF